MNLYMRYSEYVLNVLYVWMRTELASRAEYGISNWVRNNYNVREILPDTTEDIHKGDKPHMQQRAYAGSRYRPQPILNTTSDFLPRDISNKVGFWQTAVIQMHSICIVWHGARFDPDYKCKDFITHKLLPLHIASPANYHMVIGFGWRHGDGSWVAWEIDHQ